MDVLTSIFVLYYAVGYTLLATTSARYLLPQKKPAMDMFMYGLSITTTKSSRDEVIIKIKVLIHIIFRCFVMFPLFAYLWLLDEILYPEYRTVKIVEPVISLVTPRSGSTSFQTMISLDNRLLTPKMIDYCFPILCLHRFFYHLVRRFPKTIPKMLKLLFKEFVSNSDELGATHTIDMFAPEVDDILLGIWHYLTFTNARKVPKPEFMATHTVNRALSIQERDHTNQFLHLVWQKVLHKERLYSGGRNFDVKRLCIRSHRSNWSRDFHRMYPDAVYMGIVRDPVPVLRSLSKLVSEMILDRWDLDIFNDDDDDDDDDDATKTNDSPPKTDHRMNDVSTWPGSIVTILNECFGSEADLYEATTTTTSFDDDNDNDNKKSRDANQQQQQPHGYYTTFPAFREDPVLAIQNLYDAAGITMTKAFLEAMRKSTKDHKTYKERHKYQNPTLEQLTIKEESFRALPNVKRYTAILEQGPSKKES